MATRKKPARVEAPAAAPAGRRKGFKGYEKVMVRLRPEQAEALRAEAFRRAAAAFDPAKKGSARPDASEIVREILDGKLDPAKVFRLARSARRPHGPTAFHPGRYDEKLGDAELALERMRAEADARDGRPFRQSFRAFLASARSVLEYVYNECEARGCIPTYETLVSGKPLFRYFRELRDQDVHRVPAGLSGVITAGKSFTLHIQPGSRPSRDGRTPTPVITGISGNDEWRLPKALQRDGKEIEWPGPGRGEVFESCGLYLTALRGLLEEASVAGCITLP